MTPAPLTLVCAWCNRVRIGGEWVQSSACLPVSHGICPSCEAETRAAWGLIESVPVFAPI